MDLRIVTSIDSSLHRLLGEIAVVERRSLKDQASVLLEQKIIEEHARLRQDPEWAARLVPHGDVSDGQADRP